MSRVEELKGVTSLRELSIGRLDHLKAESALRTIKRALSLEPLTTAPIERILDFGCGHGDPTSALVNVAETIDADLSRYEEV